MATLIILLICAFLTWLLQGIYQAYFQLHPKELQRRAERGKQSFRKMQQVTRYGVTAKALLRAIQFIFAAATVIIICRRFDPLTALILLAIFAGILSYAKTKNPNFVINAAARIASPFSSLLHYVEPLFELVTKLMPTKRRSVTTDIYDRDDLKELIHKQRIAVNNRIEQSELESALRALDFEGKKIKDVMTKQDEIHFVGHKEPIGPILLSELHKTGFDSFPVKGNSKEEILGRLEIHKLAKHAEGGTVSEAMDPNVVYLHQGQKLECVLQGFAKTGSNMFMVIDDHEKIVGLVTLGVVLEQMIGRSIDTNFETYNDPSAVVQEHQSKSDE